MEKARITLEILKLLDDDLPKSRERKQLIEKAMMYGDEGGYYYGETLNGLPHPTGRNLCRLVDWNNMTIQSTRMQHVNEARCGNMVKKY